MLQPKNNNILLKNVRQESRREGRTQITFLRGAEREEGHVPAANTMRKTLSLLPSVQLLSLFSHFPRLSPYQHRTYATETEIYLAMALRLGL